MSHLTDEKIIVISGANSGIGLALCKKYRQQRGPSTPEVYGLCRTSSPELDALDINVITGVDISIESGLDIMFNALKTVDIDVLICVAGIWLSHQETLDSLHLDNIRRQFEVNALGSLRMVQRLIKQLRSGSKIAIISSHLGSITGNDSGGLYGYRMSRAALNMAAMCLARDVNDEQIAVGVYHPGVVKTKSNDFSGPMSPDESATGLYNLISELSMTTSGEFRHVSGEHLPW